MMVTTGPNHIITIGFSKDKVRQKPHQFQSFLDENEMISGILTGEGSGKIS